jgi:hypothetical protein
MACLQNVDMFLNLFCCGRIAVELARHSVDELLQYLQHRTEGLNRPRRRSALEVSLVKYLEHPVLQY